MIASSLQIGLFWFKYRKFEFTHVIALILISVLGTATLLLRNKIFIKWKPTAVYWVLALLFSGSQIIGAKPFIQRLIGNKLTMPQNIWQRLNFSWVLFFGCMGGVNLYIAYNFSTDTWVNFKLFGFLGSTIVFGLLQSFYLRKYLKQVVNDPALAAKNENN
jgi:intracellular septation protein